MRLALTASDQWLTAREGHPPCPKSQLRQTVHARAPHCIYDCISGRGGAFPTHGWVSLDGEKAPNDTVTVKPTETQKPAYK